MTKNDSISYLHLQFYNYLFPELQFTSSFLRSELIEFALNNFLKNYKMLKIILKIL